MTVENHFMQLLTELQPIYGKEEARAIAYGLLEHFLQLPKSGLLLRFENEITHAVQAKLRVAADELIAHKPLQYVTGKTWFYSKEFMVNEHVLIPRPETEEIVQAIINEIKVIGQMPVPFRILDIGTGSGCIAISIKKEFPEAEVTAIDISDQALKVATTNAQMNEVLISFSCFDILNTSDTCLLPQFNYIVSNPPYVTAADKALMRRNVLDYEPHTALFVPDDNPLLFYKAIAVFAVEKLISGGVAWLETNEQFGEEVKALFNTMDFAETSVIKDLRQKNRFVRAIRR